MAKVNLSDLASDVAITRINANNAIIEGAFENTLSRDGSAPNTMEASIDMNSNRILNLPPPASANEPARLVDLTGVTLISQALPSQTGQAGQYLTTNGSVLDWEFAPVYVPRTPAEIAAGVMPSSTAFLEGEGQRYGVVGDGITDDRAAIMRAYAVYKAGGARPRIRPAAGSTACLVLRDGANDWGLLLDSNADFEDLSIIGDGTNNYSLVYLNGGTNIRARFKKCRFDGGKTSPTRAAATNDIGIRFGSSIDWVEIDDCDFLNLVEDGVYFNVTVSGAGGQVHNSRFTNIYRSAVTVVAGRRLQIHHNVANAIKLQPFNINATNNSTILRDIAVEDNLILDGGDANGVNDVIDRAAILLNGKTGASVANQQNLNARRNTIINYGDAYAGSMLVLGIETREITDTHVQENFVTGSTPTAGTGWGLYSYLTTRAVYEGNKATLCDIGLRMNACTDYSDIGNTCFGNTVNKNYNGPDGATIFLRADGLNEVLAAGSVSFSGGNPSLNGGRFNCVVGADLGVGDTRFDFVTQANTTGNYRVIPQFRSATGTSGRIVSASHTQTGFRIVTLTAGVAADEAFDFEVRGCFTGTVEP